MVHKYYIFDLFFYSPPSTHSSPRDSGREDDLDIVLIDDLSHLRHLFRQGHSQNPVLIPCIQPHICLFESRPYNFIVFSSVFLVEGYTMNVVSFMLN